MTGAHSSPGSLGPTARATRHHALLVASRGLVGLPRAPRTGRGLLRWHGPGSRAPRRQGLCHGPGGYVGLPFRTVDSLAARGDRRQRTRLVVKENQDVEESRPRQAAHRRPPPGLADRGGRADGRGLRRPNSPGRSPWPFRDSRAIQPACRPRAPAGSRTRHPSGAEGRERGTSQPAASRPAGTDKSAKDKKTVKHSLESWGMSMSLQAPGLATPAVQWAYSTPTLSLASRPVPKTCCGFTASN